MNAEIIAVGTELLLGDIVNTNAQFLSRELSALGMNVFYVTVVGDNVERLKSCIDIASNRADVLFFTGGLGPTDDDLTKETVCEYFGKKLVCHEESLARMKRYFREINRKMTQNNLKQVDMPEDGIVLPNDHGTAPGCIITKDNLTAVLMPGPPFEMQPMFLNYVKPYFQKQTSEIIQSRTLRLFGIGESQAANDLKEILVSQTNPTIAPYAKMGEVHFRITAKATKESETKKMIDTMEKKVRDVLGEYIYGYDEDTLESVMLNQLKERNMTIATAESCTGGLVSQRITALSGASDVFRYGVVTYSNEAKIRLLDVDEQVIKRYGAVSHQTAVEMAYGIRRVSGSNIGISVTGIAGPTGGSKEKPVGLVYIGLSTKNGTVCKKLTLNGSRDNIRQLTAMNVFSMVLNYLKNNA